MKFRMPNLSKSSRHKAQFFVLSAVAIVTILFFVSRLLEPLAITDTSQAALGQEIFVFNDVREKAFETVKSTTTSCQDVLFNLQEFKSTVENYALEQGYFLNFSAPNIPVICDPMITPSMMIIVNQTLVSPSKFLQAVYCIPWQTTCS